MSRVSGPMMLLKRLVQRRDDVLGVVDAQRGLRDVGDRRVGRNVELRDVGFGLHQFDRRGNLAHRAFDFRVAGVADQDELAALADVALALIVNLGHQRTGRVQHRQFARRGFFLDVAGDAMRAENRHGVFGDFRQRLDEHARPWPAGC